ncbi:MAG: 4Fe-4S dicluster domain-containing protein [Candidatus Binatia bacterium]
MKQLRIIPDKCTSCLQCELACSFVQTGTFQPSRSVIRVYVFDEQASYAPYTCFQCNEAWCMTACPVNAIAVDPTTGAKVVMDNVCVGCAVCTIACPYGTVFYNPDTRKAFKCDLCGGEPACVTACPTGAIEYTDMQQPDWLASWAEKVNTGFQVMQEGGKS